MTGSRNLIGWIFVAFLVVVLIYVSVADRPHPEGYTGSYLGRTIADSSSSQDSNALSRRVQTQRF